MIGVRIAALGLALAVLCPSPHASAFGIRPLPIGFDKTISQPLIVAVMTDMLELQADDVVLEIGTGLGYQSAVLAELAGDLGDGPAAG